MNAITPKEKLMLQQCTGLLRYGFSVCTGVLLLAMPAAAIDYKLETVADQLHHPWSVAFLPTGDFLVTERRGQLLRISADGKARTVLSGVPQTYVAGQGGFFDIVLHPQFAQNQQVYLSYAHGSAGENRTGVIRATLTDDALEHSELILQVATPKDTPQHYGGRLLFLPDGTLLVATGDGFEYREQAQSIGSELGKVLRVNDDGSTPEDNPFKESDAARIWTYGHRNTQGLALNRETAVVYLHEHGPRGGDEVNILEPGLNYGWPAITYGIDYSGAHVSPFTELEGMEQPIKYWVPSIAPSGMAWYGGSLFPQWQGDLFVGALVDKEVRRLDLEDDKVVNEEALFTEIGERIRDVRASPDGYLYLLTDSPEGSMIRVSPSD
jgi:glucose/arabinose dehydrogenase